MRTPARTRGNQAKHMQVPGEAHATHKPASGQRDHPGLHQNCCPSGSHPAEDTALPEAQPEAEEKVAGESWLLSREEVEVLAQASP